MFLLTMLVLNNQMWDVIGDRLRQTRDDNDIQVYNVKDVVNVFELLLCFDHFSKSDDTFKTNDVCRIIPLK